jgi:hypothetical protein
MNTDTSTALTAQTHRSTSTRLRPFTRLVTSAGSLKLSAPKAGEVVELILLQLGMLEELDIPIL